MDQILGQSATANLVDDRLVRAIRASLVVYLSPVILLVLAIGAVGSLTTRLFNPSRRPSGAEGANTHGNHVHLSLSHKSNRMSSSA